MNQNLQSILNLINSSDNISDEIKESIRNSIKNAEKDIVITTFKLDRTEKVKRTTAILLEETIEELEQKRKSIEETNSALQKSLEELKSTQAQLIQSEKMASLGELTAGIAHEIQNPLNFVNNFSEVSSELIQEMIEEMDKGETEEAKMIAKDIQQNLDKINHHGKRADTIVKGMLQHSKKGEGHKELTNINTLCEEFLKLSYHGIRAKDKLFNATLITDFDNSLAKIKIIPQDISRVIMNVLTNAFYAVDDKRNKIGNDFQPTVTIKTIGNYNNLDGNLDEVIISIEDNGLGIPHNILDKIFQPFFTTKPTGQGTGLGLSLAYDIIKTHNGLLNVETSQGEGSTFYITIPVVK